MHVTLRRVRATRCYREKAITITHSECVFVVLVIQHAMRMRQMPFVVCLAIMLLYVIS